MTVVYVTGNCILCPHPQPKWGTYWFWCGSRWRRRPRSLLSALYLLNQRVDFSPNLQRHIIGTGKRSDWILVTLTLFSRSHQPFELSHFDQKRLSAPYLLNQMMVSGQTSCIKTLGRFKDLIRFWWSWPNFQGHHTIKTLKMSLVCPLSPEPNSGFWSNLHRNTIGAWKRND